jgi:hypothetical protein
MIKWFINKYKGAKQWIQDVHMLPTYKKVIEVTKKEKEDLTNQLVVERQNNETMQKENLKLKKSIGSFNELNVSLTEANKQKLQLVEEINRLNKSLTLSTKTIIETDRLLTLSRADLYETRINLDETNNDLVKAQAVIVDLGTTNKALTFRKELTLEEHDRLKKLESELLNEKEASEKREKLFDPLNRRINSLVQDQREKDNEIQRLKSATESLNSRNKKPDSITEATKQKLAQNNEEHTKVIKDLNTKHMEQIQKADTKIKALIITLKHLENKYKTKPISSLTAEEILTHKRHSDLAKRAFKITFEIQTQFTAIHRKTTQDYMKINAALNSFVNETNQVLTLAGELIETKQVYSMQIGTKNRQKDFKKVEELNTAILQKNKQFKDSLQQYTGSIMFMHEKIINGYKQFNSIERAYFNPLLEGIRAGLLGHEEYKLYLIRLEEALLASLDQNVKDLAIDPNNDSNNSAAQLTKKSEAQLELLATIAKANQQQKIADKNVKTQKATIPEQQKVADKNVKTSKDLDDMSRKPLLSKKDIDFMSKIQSVQDSKKASGDIPIGKGLQPITPGLDTSKSTSTSDLSTQALPTSKIITSYNVPGYESGVTHDLKSVLPDKGSKEIDHDAI